MSRLDLPTAWPPEYPLHVPISTEIARSLDARASTEFALPSLVLMEHAARGIAALAARMAPPGQPIHVLCGPGNNGGDGYGAARFLGGCGFPVVAWRCAAHEPGPGDARREFELLAAQMPIHAAHAAPQTLHGALQEATGLVVDALFGVGLSRPLAAPYTPWIEALNASQALRLAVDVPSGMDADSGQPLPVCVQAHATATMAAPKRGLAAAPAAAGHVVEVDIGLPAALHGPYRRESGA